MSKDQGGKIENLIRKYMVKKINNNSNIDNTGNSSERIKDRKESINELKRLTQQLNEKDTKLKEHYKLIELENSILKLLARGKNFNYILEKLIKYIEGFNEEDNIFCNILEFDEKESKLYNISYINIPSDYEKIIENGIKIDTNIFCNVNNCKMKIIKINDIKNDNSNYLSQFSNIKDVLIKDDVKAYHMIPITGFNNKFLGIISVHFRDNSYKNSIYEKLLCWAGKITSIILERRDSELQLTENIAEIKHKNKLLESIIDASGGYLWMKDQDYIYRFCDYLYHLNIFGKRDKEDIVGKTDTELSNDYTKETGKRHQLKDVSTITDDYTIKTKVQSKFICGCYIGDDFVILETIKTPLLDVFGNFKGIVGFTWDRSNERDLVFKDIDLLKEEKRIEVLGDKEYPEIPFVYYIVPNRKYYRKIISKPIYEDSTIVDKRTFIENILND